MISFSIVNLTEGIFIMEISFPPNIEHPLSSIGDRASSIQHRVSTTVFPETLNWFLTPIR
jgi:hypothetical protein